MDIHNSTIPTVTRLIEAFHRLPGIGPKTAQRLTYHLIRMPEEEAKEFSEAVLGIKEKITFCSFCSNISQEEICLLCSNDNRDKSKICVVEEPLDIVAIERTRAYNGLYQVLHGVISPMNGIGPENLKISKLLERLKSQNIEEIIIATNPKLEGEATAMYIENLISPLNIKITRLARGLPSGSDIEYADDSTLEHALNSRSEIQNDL
ncbi:MAG: recombination protein RecR [Chloroflexi bacterium]|nr:recombination protein RecR [Chloroflexota bacterium]|tara:strand:- start:748 stop:1368 length:621 start_codon:yes stop_codon:yes gene_type:complete